MKENGRLVVKLWTKTFRIFAVFGRFFAYSLVNKFFVDLEKLCIVIFHYWLQIDPLIKANEQLVVKLWTKTFRIFCHFVCIHQSKNFFVDDGDYY